MSPEGSRCRVLVNGSLQSSMAHRSVSTPALLMIGTALLNYGFSLVDVWTVAGEDFLYPTYGRAVHSRRFCNEPRFRGERIRI